MDEWLDSLSEDWISQPRSSHSNSTADLPPSSTHSSPRNNLSQSRIPRFKSRTASNLSGSDTAVSSRKLSGQADMRTTLPLTESTSSELNAAQRPRFRRASKTSSPLVPRPSGKRVKSTSSLSHVPQDTVQHKPLPSSPARNHNLQHTPDWKRRIIQGKVAPGDQCDLFSPIPLEKVFRPPSSGSNGKHGRGVANKRSKPEEYPSSPPPYPSRPKGKSDVTSQDRAQYKSPILPTKRNSENKRERPGRRGAPRVRLGEGEATRDDSKKNARISEPSSGLKSRTTSVLARSSQNEVVALREKSSAETPPIQSYQSTSPSHSRLPEQSPNSSLRRDYRDENISPFFVSRHQTLDGRVDYAALDMSVNQLRGQMAKLHLQQQQSERSLCSSDHEIEYKEAKSQENSSLPEFENDWTAHSLPDDLSMGTDAFVAHGGFVNMRRGGYSNDGSFQKRPLSPSSLPPLESSEVREHPRHSGNTLDIPPETEPELPVSAPTTPGKRLQNEPISPTRTQSSGSPLKLFDKYDTFTNDRVSRRISKFEEDMRGNLDQEAFNGSHESIGSPSRRSRHPRARARQIESFERSQKRMNSFGEGELDNHSFSSSQPSKRCVSPGQKQNHDLHDTCGRDSDASRFNLERPPTSPYQMLAGDKGFVNVSSSVSQLSAKTTLSQPRKSTSKVSGEKSSTPKRGGTPNDDVHNAQGKRVLQSPIKDYGTKRRRTLKSSEEANHESPRTTLNANVKRPVLNSVVGKKRKDALYDSHNQVADAETLAMRTILRPRTFTPGQGDPRDRGCHEDIPSEARNAEIKTGHLSAQTLPALHEPLTKGVAEQVARFAFDGVQDIKGSRKASVSTADFFSEAQQIMRVIRAQGRPQRSHETPQEVEPDHQASFEKSMLEESPKDGFSRPPSRAGASLRRLREPVQLSARVVSHLRKFEEKGDFEIVFSSPSESVQLQHLESKSLDAKMKRDNSDDDPAVESDPPNLRIYRQKPPEDNRNRSPAKDPPSVTTGSKSRSLASQTSGPSTERSLPTGSSRGSSTKAMILPETVSHLLSDQIAGMKYDHNRQVWVKSLARESSHQPRQTGSEGSEDVLDDIPDLSVDEVAELQRIKDHASSLKRTETGSYSISKDGSLTREGKQPFQTNNDDIRPRTAEGAISASEEDGSARSKYSRFASSGPIPETRATSWGADVPPGAKEGTQTQSQRGPTTEDKEDHKEEEVEHEISILEGRSSKTPTRSTNREHHARVVTISFSSPLVENCETPYPPDAEPDDRDDGSDFDLDASPIRSGRQPEAPRSSRRSSFDRRNRRVSSRRISINSQSYIARPMSRLDEEDENGILQTSNGFRNTSIDVIVSTPLARQRDLLAPQALSGGHTSNIGFHLSPLPDFTIHQTDQSVNQGHGDIVRRRGLLAAHETGKFALVTQQLVKKLTDLEPYEPHWDLIRSMNLQDQGLATLHTLDEFCGRLEQLDVSNNSLEQLNGAPPSIRDLRICSNHLSDLSTWGHLCNLQYLDVSRNHLRTFKAFQQLVHLRELKADDNEIESLDGLFQLDGLLSLRLRGNLVRSIDFQGSNL